MVDQEFITNLRAMRRRSDVATNRWTGASLRYNTNATSIGELVFTEHIDMGEGHDPRFVDVRISTPTTNRVNAWRTRNLTIGLVAAQTGFSKYSFGVLDTFLNLIRPGDDLYVDWLLGNDTEAMRDGGFTHDDVKLRISRKGKNYAELHWADVTTRADNWLVGFDNSHAFEVHT